MKQLWKSLNACSMLFLADSGHAVWWDFMVVSVTGICMARRTYTVNSKYCSSTHIQHQSKKWQMDSFMTLGDGNPSDCSKRTTSFCQLKGSNEAPCVHSPGTMGFRHPKIGSTTTIKMNRLLQMKTDQTVYNVFLTFRCTWLL